MYNITWGIHQNQARNIENYKYLNNCKFTNFNFDTMHYFALFTYELRTN